ncbi:MAG: hypothetical protein A2Z57_06110 [Planctomycetes bacterium RIFCSPHIGHO2_12_39_6]|nr:MAG: hypothetical protein A2Z57_06110 [Planctomycetes bacterium RIFCSPHIGHO2_12_39_6]
MHHGVEKVKIFEIAKVYLADDRLPREKTCLGIVADVDFYTLKGIIESLLLNLGIILNCELVTAGVIESKLFKDGKAAKIKLSSNILGYLGEAKEFGFKTSPYMAELDMDLLVEKSNFTKKYQTLSQYPPVFRDLAVIIKEDYIWADIENCVKNTKANYLEEINFFDIYRGKQIPAGMKSIAFNLCFQSQDRTLKSEEVDLAVQTILNSLHETLGAELRKQ